MLGLGQALEPDLDLDPLADVARDRDHRGRAVGQLHPLDHELHGDRRAVRRLELGHDRAHVAPAGCELVDDGQQPRRLHRRESIRQ